VFQFSAVTVYDFIMGHAV